MNARRAVSNALTLSWMAAALAGCGSDEPAASASATSSASSSTSGGGAIACDGEPADLALDGTWAAYGRLSVSFEAEAGGAITICPADQLGESTLLLLLRFSQDAADPTHLDEVTATLCSLELPVVSALVGDCDPTSSGLVDTQIIAPDELIAALPSVATNPVEGTLTGRNPGSTLALDRLVVTVGSTKGGAELPRWDLDSPACGAADRGHAQSCDDTCVTDCGALRDDDDDGYPGVTAQVCGFTASDRQAGVPCNADDPSDPGATLQGRAYLDLEVNPLFSGVAKSSCEIEGSVETSVLYNLVGADVFLAGGAIGVASAIRSLPSFAVVSDQSLFRMVRIDGQYGAPDWGVDPESASAACATVVSHVNEL